MSFHTLVLRAAVATCILAAAVSGRAAGLLSLDEAIRLATARSRQLDAHNAVAAAARERAVAAGQPADPVLKFGVNNLPITGADRYRLTPDFMTMRSLGLMQEITRADKLKSRAGRFERADGGTLLLDEIRDLPLHLQAALLRFLDDQLVRPVGGQTSRRVDVQLLAATHADLEEAVRTRAFREDLWHRLSTVRVTLPPLRNRRDLPEAVRWVLGHIEHRLEITDSAVAYLARHPWPGNFRELRAVLTRALLHRAAQHESHRDQQEHQDHLDQRDKRIHRDQPLNRADIEAVLHTDAPPLSASRLQRGAAELVRTEFERSGHSVSQTARALGVSRTTVYRHLRS